MPKGSKPIRAVLAVPPAAFIAMWWAIQVFHVFCVVNSYAIIEIHRYCVVTDLATTIDYLGTQTFSYFKPVIAAHGVLIACHGMAFFWTVWWSVKCRDWRLTSLSTDARQRHPSRFESSIRPAIATGHEKTGTNITRSSFLPPLDSAPAASPCCATARLTLVLKRLLGLVATFASALFRQVGMFGVEGSYYEVGFIALELVEIIFQTYQAYKLSGLVSRVWINRLNAIVLVLNCWSAVVVHSLVHRDRIVKRVVLLVVDAFFDVITSMVIPFVIFYPYYMQFNLTVQDFPVVNYYDDVWFVQAISENSQIFVTSWFDFVSKLSTWFSIFATMLVLKQNLVVVKVQTQDAMQGTCAFAPRGESRGRSLLCQSMGVIAQRTRIRVAPARAPLGATLSDARTHEEIADGGIPRTTSEQRFIEAARFVKERLRWHDLLFVLWGLAILVLHVHATAIGVYSRVRGCLLEVRPWFQTTYNCISLELNCAHGQFESGSNYEALHQAADLVDVRRIKSIVVSSCAKLHVPPLLQSLSTLQMIKVYNSTIGRWEVEAELREDLHSDLQMLYVCDSNFSTSELPRGLLSDHFPTRLVDIEFSGTNLVRLPSDLHEKWPLLQYFVLERSPQITEIPQVLVKMKIPQLTLRSNSIASIPDDLLADQAFWCLRLDGNPLTRLPEQIGTIESLYNVGISSTLIQTLPSWMTTMQVDRNTGQEVIPYLGSVRVLAGGSPLCLDGNGTTAERTRASAMPYFHWNCSRRSPFTYPIEQERRWRAASTAAQDEK